MYQKSDPRGDSPVSIIGAGIAGAWQALLFAQAAMRSLCMSAVTPI